MKMMRIITSLLAASSLGMPQVATAVQQTQTDSATTASSGTCKGSAFTWKRLGGDPFATTNATAMKKLPKALADMVAAGCLPQGAVDGLLKLIRENPAGTEVDGGHKLVTLTNGMHLDFMESNRHGPYLNVTVGLVKVGKGLVTGIQAKIWVFDYEGVRYYLYDPLICHNWGLQRQGTPPPSPPQQEQCYLIRTVIHPGEDAADHTSFWGPDAMRGNCWHWRFEGGQWQDYRQCADNCDYRGIQQELGGMQLAYEGRISFAQRPPNAHYVEYSVSREFATQNVNLALVCRKLLSRQMSCGKMVRYDDYHSTVATIYRSLDEYTADHAVGRVLVFDFFSDPRDCHRKWTH